MYELFEENIAVNGKGDFEENIAVNGKGDDSKLYNLDHE